MIIAIASDGNKVSQHFGHCESFSLIDIEKGKIIDINTIENPGHKPGFLPNFLHEKGVEVIISGGMGQGAVEIFNNNNIQVILGAQGDIKEVAQKFVDNKLVSEGSICDKHEHSDECGNH